MNDAYFNIKNRSDIGCFCIGSKKSDKKKGGGEWLNKKIPLHFFLMFLILFCGVILSIPHHSFLNKNVRLWSASLVSVFDAEFEEGPGFDKDIEPQFVNPVREDKDYQKMGDKQFSNGVKLPLVNNIVYELPLSENRRESAAAALSKLEASASLAAAQASPALAERAISANQREKVGRLDMAGINGKYIEVDISNQVMTVYGDGELKGLYKVSTGMSGYRTPTGNFKVLRKSANVWSQACQCWMPYAMEFKSGLFIHELPYWPGRGREGEAHLGQPVSHGCVRLGIGPAKEVFDFADIGTPVIIRQ